MRLINFKLPIRARNSACGGALPSAPFKGPNRISISRRNEKTREESTLDTISVSLERTNLTAGKTYIPITRIISLFKYSAS